MDSIFLSDIDQGSQSLIRVGLLSEELLKDLPSDESIRERILIERALRYAAETEELMAEQRDKIAQLENLSFTDPMTGILNRRGFKTQLKTILARSRRYGEIGIVGFCDIDNLKQVNDTNGHNAGDELIKCAARAVGKSIRDTDIVGRLGGDEFAIVLVNTSWKNGAQRLRALQWVFDATGIVYKGIDLPLQVSLGMEPYGPHDEVEDLIHRADMAMYYNKRRKQAEFTGDGIAAE